MSAAPACIAVAHCPNFPKRKPSALARRRFEISVPNACFSACPEHSKALYSYDGHVGSVNIAELKNQLSSFLHRVRAGEELVIRDRNLPIAKIVPLRGEDMNAEELSLVASGQMTLPKQELDRKRFWAIGGGTKRSRKLANAIQRAIAADQEDYGGPSGTQARSFTSACPGKAQAGLSVF